MYSHVHNTEHYNRIQSEFLSKCLRFLGLSNLVYLPNTHQIGAQLQYQLEKCVNFAIIGICFFVICNTHLIVIAKAMLMTVLANNKKDSAVRDRHSEFWQLIFLAMWSWSMHSTFLVLVQKHKLKKPINELLRILHEVEQRLGRRIFVQTRLFWLLRIRDLFTLLTVGVYIKTVAYSDLLPNCLYIILYELAYNSVILYLQIAGHLYCSLNEYVSCKCVLSLEQREALRRSMNFLNEFAIRTHRQHCNLLHVVEDLRKWLICRVFMACIILVQALRCYYFRSHATAMERLNMIAGYLPLYISLILEIYIVMELNSLRERESQKFQKNLIRLATYLWRTCSTQDPYRSSVHFVWQQINLDLVYGSLSPSKLKYRPNCLSFLRLSTIFLFAYLTLIENDNAARATQNEVRLDLDQPCNLTCLSSYYVLL